MAALNGIVLVAAVAATGPAHADPVGRWRDTIEEASVRFGVPARWVEQVIRAESGGLTSRGGRPIRSRKGAIGLMQLMPATWATMRERLGLGPNPDDPRDNIFAGTFFLRLMYDRFGYPGLFAAYNAGPGGYARHLVGGALPDETRIYLAKILGAAPTGVAAPRLFAVRYGQGQEVEESTPSGGSIFAIRSPTP